MTDPLGVYLHDHRAGATFALELLEQLVEEHSEEPLGAFAAKLRSEIGADVRVLEGIIARLGLEGAGPAKQVAVWIGEKASRVRLRRAAGRGLGTLLVLETLSLGVLGKLALWQALADLAPRDGSLHGIDFRRLADRARSQHARLEERRLDAARAVLDVNEEGRRAARRRGPWSVARSDASLRAAALVAVAVAIPAVVLLTGARARTPSSGQQTGARMPRSGLPTGWRMPRAAGPDVAPDPARS
jgi:hypothetical protein